MRLKHYALDTLANVSVMLRPDCAQAKWGEGDTRCDGDGWRRPQWRQCPALPCAPRPPGRTLQQCSSQLVHVMLANRRWQVADLGDAGRNVNNWHWTEKDALPWCRERLQGGWMGWC